MNEETAYPLSWPIGRPRTPRHHQGKSPFRTTAGGKKTTLTVAGGRDRLFAELERLGATSVVVSSNVELRLDGIPRSGQPEPQDVGVAVYFAVNKERRVMACDRWNRVADNLAAVGETIARQRAILRYGAVTSEQIFAGFRALPAPGQTSNDHFATAKDAASWLGAETPGIASAIGLLTDVTKYRAAKAEAVKKHHPDRNGGEPMPSWHTLQAAIALLDKHHNL